MPPSERPRPKRRRTEMGLAGMGFDLAAAVGVAAALGWWIDRRYDTEPWGLVVCALIGIVGGLYNFAKAGRRAQMRAQEKRNEREGEHEG